MAFDWRGFFLFAHELRNETEESKRENLHWPCLLLRLQCCLDGSEETRVQSIRRKGFRRGSQKALGMVSKSQQSGFICFGRRWQHAEG
jgi:hypothetical protein